MSCFFGIRIAKLEQTTQPAGPIAAPMLPPDAFHIFLVLVTQSKDLQDAIQKLTDKTTKTIDETVSAKEKEILKV